MYKKHLPDALYLKYEAILYKSIDIILFCRTYTNCVRKKPKYAQYFHVFFVKSGIKY